MATKKGNRAAVTIYIDPESLESLKKLSEDTRVPQAVYWREALDDLLEKYKVKPKRRVEK